MTDDADKIGDASLAPILTFPTMNKTTTRARALEYIARRQTTGAIRPNTAAVQRSQLMRFCDVAPTDPSRISEKDIVRWARTHAAYSPGTRRLYWSIVKGFTTWLVRTTCAATRSSS